MKRIGDKFNSIIENKTKSLIFIFILTFLAFSNIFNNQFIADDFSFIVNWPLIRDFKNIPQFFIGYTPPLGQDGIFTPFKTLIHSLNYHLFGLNTFGHHVVSLLVHFSAIFFIYKIIDFIAENKRVAFLSTLFFALHPVHCESITSMTGSVDTIGIVFLFISFYFYIKDHKHGINKRGKNYWFSLIFSLLAIGISELTASFPLLLIWYEICFFRKRDKIRNIAWKLMPFFSIVLGYIFCKYLVLGAVSRGSYVFGSFSLTMLIAIKSFAKYIYICIFPVVLTHNHVISEGIYSFDPSDFDRFSVLTQSSLDFKVLLSGFLWSFLFYITFKVIRTHRLISFSIGWFFICLLPVSNIIPSGVLFGERYLYPGTLGFCLLMGLYFKRLYSAKGSFYNIKLSNIGLILIGIIAVSYAFRLLARNFDFRDEVVAYESAVKANPQSALMRNDLGIIYTQYNMPSEALRSFKEALLLRKDPVTYFSMAEAYKIMGKNIDAEISLKKAIEIDPEYAEAHYNLASLYAFWARDEDSMEHLKKAFYFYEKKGEGDKVPKYKESFESYFGPLDM